MLYEIGKTFEFAAAQFLEGMPDGHPCAMIHGHTYTVTIIVGAEELDEHGMVVDYHELAPFKDYIDETFDHACLNYAVDFNPTAENLAFHLFDVAKDVLFDAFMVDDHRARVVAVRVCESPRTFAEYRP